VLSLESQEKELLKIAKDNDLEIVGTFKESKSAKAEGRPVFNQMLKMITSGKADAIICWKLDRLARNFIDGGKIIDLLQKGIIQEIRTYESVHLPKDNVTHGEKVPKITTLQKFWEWRLKESDAPSELREFGWWAKEGKFNNKWMLEQLLKTVEKTKGDVNGEFIVMHSLDILAPEYPLLSAKILKLIFASTSRRDRYVFLHVAELRSALIKILKTNNDEAKKVAHQTIDYLLKLGVEDMKNLEDLAK
jgi:hypothetical protein